MQQLLRQLGLRPGWIYEAVVCTSLEGRPHAAPAGVATDDCRSLRLDLYDTSRTLGALLSSGVFVCDLPAGADTLFRALYAPEELTFARASRIDAPRLADSAATIELVVVSTAPRGGLTRVRARVVAVTRHTDVRLINRAEPLLVESLILATRIRLAGRETTLAQLDENLRVAEKVAPGSAAAGSLRRLRRQLDGRS
ncbi:MAG: DUF447 family protein [Actinobacteria bacterium]|nr:DUF447 family protein [Actinomycetota bacterium]OPZ46667.1 MAG: hypothetical protein BWY94_00449 [Actinobacteria bacterium ADurb.BinA094]